MEENPEIRVRRARPSDADCIAEFINRAQGKAISVSAGDVRGRFGVIGFLLTERDGEIVGFLGWRVENLVARVTDFLVWPAKERLVAGRAMVNEMEQAARELQCEVALLYLPREVTPQLLAYWEAFGYESKKVESLPKAWREAAQEVRSLSEWVVVKQIREDMISRPL
ncbi:MAG: GNAT family N-acetyltransferase [Anaerolineae bacterium]|jgi:N-acetylglutamate synthase-like GNAT family acetyltransferase